MGMPEADVQLASRLASAVAGTAAAAGVPGLPLLQPSSVTPDPEAAAAAAGEGEDTNDGDDDAELLPGASLAAVWSEVPIPTTAAEGHANQAAAEQASVHAQPAAGSPAAVSVKQQPQQQQQQQQPGVLPAGVLGVEHHARPQADYYATTALLDFLAFVYLALFYQVGSQPDPMLTASLYHLRW
jgi:hypothetical protein